MLATSAGRLLLLSTPFGKRGHLWDLWNSGNGWERIKITAHDVPRIPRAFLEAERATLPDFVYRSEYLCEFTENQFSVFNHEDIDRALSSTITPLFEGVAA